MKRTFLTHCIFALLLFSAAAGTVLAANQVELTTRAEVEQMVATPEGKQELQRKPAEKVLPGEIVVFTNTFRNISNENATDLSVENAIPEHMTLVEDSIFCDNCIITYSVDGGQTFADPKDLFVSDASGRMWPAESRDYTHIRWTLQKELAPQDFDEVGFKARLN